MTLLEALKVAQEACDETRREKCHNQVDMTCQCSECVTLREAAAGLARLEEEWPTLLHWFTTDAKCQAFVKGPGGTIGFWNRRAHDATETAALRRLRDVMALGLSIGYFGGSPPPAGDNERIGPQAQVRIEGWLAALDAILGKRDA